MTKDKIKEVKAIYSEKNKIRHSKFSGANDNFVGSKPFFTGIIDKLNANKNNKFKK